MNVAEWLKALGLERYEAAFRENDIDAVLLPSLTADDLRDLGITSVGHRRHLLDAIAALRSKTVASGEAAGFPARPPFGQGGNLGSSEASAELRPLSVIFCDIIGFTALSSRLDPEDLREVVRAYQACVATTVRQFDGFIADYVGDGVMIYFGWPEARETNAERAVRAGLAVASVVGGTPLSGEQLQVRIGIATGLVVVGGPNGSDGSRQQAAIGETPNLAGRLQALAGHNQVVIDATTRRQIGGLFECQDLGRVELKGLPMAVPAWLVLGEGIHESRFEALHGMAMGPLIGREEELESLLRHWKQVPAGEGRIVLLTGEPGIGKSRLLVELEKRLVTQTHASMRYFCSPLHQDSVLHPVIIRWEQKAGFARGDTVEQRLRKVESVLALDEFSSTDVALLASMLDVPTDNRYPQLDLTPQRRKERTFAVLQQQLASLAKRTPVLMLLEDAHWADPSSLELFNILISEISKLPVLLVISFRPEFTSPWIDRAGVSLITLTRLDARQSAILAAQVTTTQVLTHAILEHIIRQTDGVPLFIEELTKAILEAAPTGLPRSFTVPSTLQASLMARLDRIPKAKQVAQIGAVIGREFSHVLLVAAAALTEEQITTGLDELIAAGLLFRHGQPPEASYTFKHALLQEIAYESLLKVRRQRIHWQVAETVRDQLPQRANAEPEVVAHHLTQAGLPAQAVDWWGKAGELALRRSAYTEAIAHLERALHMAGGLGDGSGHRRLRLRLQITYGNVLRLARGFGVAETQSAFSEARVLAAAVADVSERCPAYYGLWSGSLMCGNLATMQEVAAAFLCDTEGQPGLPEAATAQGIAGTTRWFEGNFLEARKHLTQALTMYDAMRTRELAFRFGHDVTTPDMVHLALVLWPLGVLDGAVLLIDQAVLSASEINHIPTMAFAHAYAAIFEMMRRDRQACAPHVQAFLDLAREHGISEWLLFGAFAEGWLRSGTDEDGAGAGLMEMLEGVAPMRSRHQELFMPLMMTLVAEAEANAGRPVAGLAVIDTELAAIERTGQRWYLSSLHRARGEILLQCRPPEVVTAETAFLRALDVARSQEAKLSELEAAVGLGRLWIAQDRPHQVRELLASICNRFDTDVDCSVLREAQATLGALATE